MNKNENNIHLTDTTKINSGILFSIRDFCALITKKYASDINEKKTNNIYIELEVFSDGSVGVIVMEKFSDYKIFEGCLLHEYSIQTNKQNS